MELNIPYLIAAAVVVMLVAIAFEVLPVLKDVAKGRRLLLHMAAIFVALLILNLVWSYDTGTPTNGVNG